MTNRIKVFFFPKPNLEGFWRPHSSNEKTIRVESVSDMTLLDIFESSFLFLNILLHLNYYNNLKV